MVLIERQLYQEGKNTTGEDEGVVWRLVFSAVKPKGVCNQFIHSQYGGI